MYIPDIATKFKKDGHSYRVTHWLKAVPVKFKKYTGKHAEILNDIYTKIFNEKHPNWKEEYRLEYCKRSDATHVEGVGVCGCIVAIESPDVEFTGVYVAWDNKTIDEARARAENFEWLNDAQMGRATYVMGEQHTK
jgi:hypothetical protein